MNRYPIFGLVISAFSLVAASANAQDAPDLVRPVILNTINESILVEISMISKRYDDAFIKQIEWHVVYSEKDFLVSMSGITDNGKEIKLSYNGITWNDDDKIRINFSGIGDVSGETLRLNGQSIYSMDSNKKDFINMDFTEVTKFGEHSFWDWFEGAEILGGGVLGGAIATGATDLATAGAAIIATPWTATYGFASGVSTALSISIYIQSHAQSEKPTAAPPKPNRPDLPQKGEPWSPGNNLLYTVMDREKLYGVKYGDKGQALILSGSYSGSEAAGNLFGRDYK